MALFSTMLTYDLKKEHVDKKLNVVWNDIVAVTKALRVGNVDEDNLKEYVKILEEASKTTEEIGIMIL